MRDAHPDQASGLRMLKPAQPVRVIAVTSGKGGVGKTTISVNLSVAMAMAGRRVMLLDGDLGLANVDVMLGLQPSFNLAHVLAGTCTLEETLLEGPGGVMIVPAASGKQHMAELTSTQHAGLVRAFSELNRPLDTLIVDTAAGIAGSVITFSQASQQVIVVVTNDPASLTDAYALIKVLNRDHGINRVQVLANMATNSGEVKEIYENLRRVAERFLDVTLSFMGSPTTTGCGARCAGSARWWKCIRVRRRPRRSATSPPRPKDGACRRGRAATWSSLSNAWCSTSRWEQ